MEKAPPGHTFLQVFRFSSVSVIPQMFSFHWVTYFVKLHQYHWRYVIFQLSECLTDKQTTRSRVHLEKLTIPQLIRKFPTYGPRSFVTGFTAACDLSFSWSRSIQSTPYKRRFFINASFNTILQYPTVLPSGLCTSGFPAAKHCMHLSCTPMRATCLVYLILPEIPQYTVSLNNTRSSH